MKIFEQFKSKRNLIEETKSVKIYKCVLDDKEYKIIITKKIANKRTIIHCLDDNMKWEQVPLIPRLAGRTDGDKVPIYKFAEDENSVIVFVIKGKPNGITGLDEGIFRCANNFSDNYVNVMTYNRFRSL